MLRAFDRNTGKEIKPGEIITDIFGHKSFLMALDEGKVLYRDSADYGIAKTSSDTFFNLIVKDDNKQPANAEYQADNTNPNYYRQGIEVIDFIECYGLNFHRGNAVKYIARAGKKDPSKESEDLRKAIWYLQRELQRIESEHSEEKS